MLIFRFTSGPRNHPCLAESQTLFLLVASGQVKNSIIGTGTASVGFLLIRQQVRYNDCLPSGTDHPNHAENCSPGVQCAVHAFATGETAATVKRRGRFVWCQYVPPKTTALPRVLHCIHEARSTSTARPLVHREHVDWCMSCACHISYVVKFFLQLAQLLPF